jgi:hypothetical protein
MIRRAKGLELMNFESVVLIIVVHIYVIKGMICIIYMI